MWFISMQREEPTGLDIPGYSRKLGSAIFEGTWRQVLLAVVSSCREMLG